MKTGGGRGDSQALVAAQRATIPSVHPGTPRQQNVWGEVRFSTLVRGTFGAPGVVCCGRVAGALGTGVGRDGGAGGYWESSEKRYVVPLRGSPATKTAGGGLPAS